MSKKLYYKVGIIYIIMALLYSISILISIINATSDYFAITKHKSNDPSTLQYKVYWYFNNFRYTTFIFLCFAIGILYISDAYNTTGH